VSSPGAVRRFAEGDVPEDHGEHAGQTEQAEASGEPEQAEDQGRDRDAGRRRGRHDDGTPI
jgi:hypothetical protein